MYSILHALQDGRRVTLCFADRKSAKDFSLLMNTYVDDSGAGNGYSAYWPDFEKRSILPSLWRPSDSVAELDSRMVERMLYSIYAARASVRPKFINERFSIGDRNGAIVFALKELPARLRPTVGDMYRIPRSLSADGLGDEGKVVEDNGDTLRVISCHYWRREGFREDVRVEEIPSECAIKIHDWLKDMYPDRTTWTFDPKEIHAKNTSY